jgi:hypothetical protein
MHSRTSYVEDIFGVSSSRALHLHRQAWSVAKTGYGGPANYHVGWTILAWAPKGLLVLWAVAHLVF